MQSEKVNNSSLIFTCDPDEALEELLSSLSFDKVLVVSDTKVHSTCKHLVPVLVPFPFSIIKEGERNKTLDSLKEVWEEMYRNGLSRNSLLINFGGGVVTDLGGFAAATYMRGIRYINIPTTLLASIDASYGGKTAIDFCGVKNLIGSFHAPVSTIVSSKFLSTLPREEMLSGYGEMLKHALLNNREDVEFLLDNGLFSLSDADMLSLIKRSVNVKKSIVDSDPGEKGLRRALNLGHTAGHALEALMLGKGESISHGHAVALGILAELKLSPDFPSELLQRLADHILSLYPPVKIIREDLPLLKNLMSRDKKNRSCSHEMVSYIRLHCPGEFEIFSEAYADELTDALAEFCI